MSNPTARIVDALSTASARSGDGASVPEDDGLSETERADIEETVKRAVRETLEERDMESRERAQEADESQPSSGRSGRKLVAGGLALASAAYLTRRWRRRSGSDTADRDTYEEAPDTADEERVRNPDGTFAPGQTDDS